MFSKIKIPTLIILIIALIFVAILLIYICFHPEKPTKQAYATEDMQLNIKREHFYNHDESKEIIVFYSEELNGYNDISIYYPHFSGLKTNGDKINRLIEEDAKKILVNNELYDKKNFYLSLDYENIFISKNVISILYKSRYGATVGGRRLYSGLVATTIDLEKAGIITLNDLFTDPDALYDMLLNGMFEGISVWEGVKGGYSIDMVLGMDREEFKRAFSAKEYDLTYDCLEWYTDGRNFVIVVSDGYYYEYSIKLEVINEIINLPIKAN